MKITLTNYNLVVEKAKASFEKYAKVSQNGSGRYRHNTIDGVLVGLKCEAATHQFLTSNGIAAILTNSDKQSDILFKNLKIEVKGLRVQQWDKFKRCIPPKQLEFYARQKALVVWGVTDVSSSNDEVTLKGWNFAQDLIDKGVFRKTICDNVWLEHDSDMRNLSELIDFMRM